MKKLLLFFLCPIFFMAQINLYRWNNTNLTSNVSDANAMYSQNVTVSAATTPYTTNNIYYQAWGSNTFISAGLQHSDALDETQYIQYTVKPNSYNALVLNLLNFQYRSQGNTIKFQVRASKDVNFNDYFIISNELIANTSYQNYSANLSSTGVVKPGETLYIRIYIYGNYDNFHFNMSPDVSVTTGIGPTITGTFTDETSQKPRVADDTFTVNINYSKVLDILNNDTYPSLSSINIVTQPSHGTVVVNGTTNVTYFPDYDYLGTDFFEYRLTNAYGTSSKARVDLNCVQGPSKVLVRWEGSSNSSVTVPNPTYYNTSGIATPSIPGFTASDFTVNNPLQLMGNYWMFYVINWHQAGNTLNPNYYIQYEVENGLNYHTRLDKFNISIWQFYNWPQYYEVYYSKSGVFDGEQLPLKKADGTTIQNITSNQTPVTWLFPTNFTLFPMEKLTVRVYAYAPLNTYSSGITLGANKDKGTSFEGIVQNIVKCKNQVTWNGTSFSQTPNLDNSFVTLDQDYNGADFETCGLLIKPGKKLTIESGHSVKVNYNFINQGELEIKSDANFVQVQDNIMNAGANLAHTTVRRNAKMKRLDYTYWGTPVIGQNLKNFSPGTLDSRFYVYREKDDYFDGVFAYSSYPGFTAADAFPLQNKNTYRFQTAKGYAIRAGNLTPSVPTDFVGTFVGFPNNGNISIDISKSPDVIIGGNTYQHGINMVSNPYPSNIDLDKFFAANPSLQKVARFWTNINPNPAMQGSQYPKTGSINNYAFYSLVGGLPVPGPACNSGNSICSPTPTNIVKVGQGFMIHTTAATIPSPKIPVTFNNSMRVTNNSGSFFNAKMANATKDRYWLELKTPLDFVTPLLVGYVEGSTNEYDEDYDAELNVIGADSFYTTLDNKKLGIQGRQFPLNTEDVVSLGAIFYEAGVHTISLGNREGVFANGQEIFLRDKLTDTVTNLSQQSYTFNAEAGEVNNRFEILYNYRTLGTDDNLAKTDVMMYKENNDYIIKSPEVIKMVKLYDASGKLISTNKVTDKIYRLEVSNFAKGVYIVEILTAKKQVTKRIIK